MRILAFADPHDDRNARAGRRGAWSVPDGPGLCSKCGNPSEERIQPLNIIEQRCAALLGQEASQMASVAVTKAEHQIFMNRCAAAIPRGSGTTAATKQSVLDAAADIYANYPSILRAIGL